MDFKTKVREEIATALKASSETLDYSGVEIEFDTAALRYDAEVVIEVGGYVIDQNGVKHHIYHNLSGLFTSVQDALSEAIK